MISQNFLKKIANKAYWFPAWQAAITLIASLAVFLLIGVKTDLAFILGGAVSFLPMVYVARTLFKESGARQAKRILFRFYRAEIIKFVIISLAFIWVFKTGLFSPFPFIAGFCISQISGLFAPLVFLVDVKTNLRTKNFRQKAEIEINERS